MSTWSRLHTVKSNATRDAVKFGLSRADVVPGEDGIGFRFMIPDAAAPPVATEAAPVAVTTLQATEPERASESVPSAVTDFDDEEAEANQMPDAWTKVAGEPVPAEARMPSTIIEVEPAARASTAKVARRTGKVAKVRAVKREKVAKPKRAGKVKSEGHGKFTGSPAFQGRRTSQGRRGVTDEVMKTLKARWTPADEILKSTGWVSNTFRGVLGKFRRDGMKVECEKRNDVTCYRIAA